MLYLQKAALTDGRDVYEMLQRIPPENGFLNSCYQMDWAEFPSWLAKRVNMAQGIGLEDWQVPSTTYWLMDDGIPVAFGSLRHQLNDVLRERGGHIGYAVDGTKQGRGYGKALTAYGVNRLLERGEEPRLEALDWNKPALSLYRRMGFAVEQRRQLLRLDL